MLGRDAAAVRLWGIDHCAFDPRGLRYAKSAVDDVSADVLFAATAGDGRQRVLLGDLAGHGRRAAACAPLLAHVFYQDVQAAGTAEDALARLNAVMVQHVPADVFMAYALVEWAPDRRRVRLWNGGLPGCFHIGAGGVNRFGSCSFPLGVMGEIEVACEVHEQAVAEGERICLFTDGLNESLDDRGESLGVAAVERWLSGLSDADRLDQALEGFLSARRVRTFADDITLVELRP